jgi:hypothetical protein
MKVKKKVRSGVAKLGYKNPHEQSYVVARQELQALQEEAVQLEERRNWISERTKLLSDYLKAIEPLMKQDPGQELVQVGLAQICRNMLERQESWFTAQQVKNRLELAGIDLQGYTNPMAVLHAVLKRVGDSFRAKDGIVYYGKKGLTPKEPEKAPEITGLSSERLHNPFADALSRQMLTSGGEIVLTGNEVTISPLPPAVERFAKSLLETKERK